MRPLARLGFAIGLAGAAALVSGCSNISLDPDKLDFSLFDTKQKLAGERKDVFPGGVPGVTPGVPPEMVKGYHEPADAPAPAGAKPKPAAGEQKRQRRSRSPLRSRMWCSSRSPSRRRRPRSRGPRPPHRRPAAPAAQPPGGQPLPWPGQPSNRPSRSPLAGAQSRQVTRAPAHSGPANAFRFWDAAGAPGARRHELYRRHRRPAQCRQIDAVQPARRPAPRAGRRHARRHP